MEQAAEKVNSNPPNQTSSRPKKGLRELYKAGYWAVPIMRHDGIVSKTSKLKQEHAPGKAPAMRKSDGTYVGIPDWQIAPLPIETLKQAERDGANAGIVCGEVAAVDNDVEDAELAQGVDELRVKHLGIGPKRIRENSPRSLTVYSVEGAPFAKMRLTCKYIGKKHAVEILCDKNQFVCFGTHKSGVELKWENGADPCVWGKANLTRIPQEKAAKFLDAVRELVIRLGGKIIDAGTSAGGGTSGPHKPIGDPDMVAKNKEMFARAVAVVPNTAEHFPNYDKEPSMLSLGASICAGFGGDEEYYSIYEGKMLEYGGDNTPETARDKWEDCMKKGTKVGASYLYDKARELGGFTEHLPTPEDDFGDGLPKEMITAKIVASPFVWRDPSAITPREWLYDQHYARKYISGTIAPGGVGKSSLAIVETLAMVTGKDLLGVRGGTAAQPLCVWYWNGEDPVEEIERRFAAACLHYGITEADIGGRLFVNSGRETKIVVAREERNGLVIAEPVVRELRDTILEKQIDVVIIDPFVASHAVSENDNGKINAVCDQWRDLAEQARCAVELVHHVRKAKFGQGEYSVDDARGAGSLLAAVRSARTINVMTEDEAMRARVDNRRLYIRVDNGKANHAPPAERSTWRRLTSVDLGNREWPDSGDNVGVVTAWKWPDPSEDVTADDVRAVQDAIAAGEWRADARAKNWAGYAVADALKLNPEEASTMTRVKSLLQMWIADESLKVVRRMDAKSELRPFVKVGKKVMW